MPSRRRARKTAQNPAAKGADPVLVGGSDGSTPSLDPNTGAPTTGRYLITYRDDLVDEPQKVSKLLENVAGVRNMSSASDFKESIISAADVEGDAHYFPALGVAVVAGDPAQMASLMSAAAESDNPIVAVEPEYIFYALAETKSAEFLRGYRSAVNHLYDEMFDGHEETLLGTEAITTFQDTAQLTWGLQATRVDVSTRNGSGVAVAVLDTGFDLAHPDFVGRAVVAQGFTGEPVQDGHGHGTHCIGTSCGPQRPPNGTRRYGIGFGANIKVGKVLSNAGGAVGSSVLFGMNWAVSNGFPVISMSLGANVDQVSTAYENAGRRAMDAGCLIIAAAGNNADRENGMFGFVGQPANARTILAVGAVGPDLKVANFSARSSSKTGDGGKVDIVGPGVDVFSSFPMNQRYRVLSGTSMATPHVAGIAALWCQATGRRGADLWATLVQNVRAIPGDVRDIGAGLAQAPN